MLKRPVGEVASVFNLLIARNEPLWNTEFLLLLIYCFFKISGLLAAGIVQEFLEFFQLDYTGAVFEPESGMVRMLVKYE